MSLLLISLFCAGQLSFAQQAHETVGRRFTVLPLAGFSSDDGSGGGARVALYEYDGKTVPYRKSYSLQAFFTTKGKWAHRFQADFPEFRPGNRLEITFRLDKEENTSFSGDLTNSQLDTLTEDERTFRQVDPYLRVRWIRDLRVPWRIRYRVRAGYTDITPNDDDASLIETLAPLGFDGGSLLQAGLALRYDTRDNYINSTAGRLDEIGLEWTFGAGGDFNGGELILEHRHFHRIRPRLIAAQRFLFTYTVGDIPFYEQPKLGSSKTLRGPSADRFRDQARILTNTELRWLGIPLVPQHQVFAGINAFADVGQVFPRKDLPASDAWKLGLGAGLRIYWYSTIVRVDYAVSDGSKALYMRFAQIF